MEIFITINIVQYVERERNHYLLSLVMLSQIIVFIRNVPCDISEKIQISAQKSEANSDQQVLREKTESKPEKSALVKKPSSRTEGINQPSKLQRPRKPIKPKLKESIQQVTNAQGKVFRAPKKEFRADEDTKYQCNDDHSLDDNYDRANLT